MLVARLEDGASHASCRVRRRRRTLRRSAAQRGSRQCAATGLAAGRESRHVRHAAGLLLRLSHRRISAHIVLTVRAERSAGTAARCRCRAGSSIPAKPSNRRRCAKRTRKWACSTDRVRVLGALTPLDIPVSGFACIRSSASATRRPELTPADGEVARILEPAIDSLMAPDCVVRDATRARRRRDDRSRRFISKATKSGARPRWCWPNFSRCWAGRSPMHVVIRDSCRSRTEFDDNFAESALIRDRSVAP